jgi:chromatin segregation and condensation protein Rec8/ScpA/Scc1 (kleisin family)
VDIVKLSDEFTRSVHEIQKLDLGMHANVILAAAILLKYKSEYLKYFTAPPVTPLPPEVDATALDVTEIPQLSLVARIPPRRQITVDELMSEMEKVIKYESAEIKHYKQGAITDYVDLTIKTEDIEKKKDETLARIRESIDEETGFATFSGILKSRNSLEIVYTLLSVLHLTQNRVIDIYQEKLFGEILISLMEESNKKSEDSNEKPGAETEKLKQKEKLKVLN